MRIVITTCKPEEAEKIAQGLLEEHLVASVNIISGVTTKVWWKGELLTQPETLLIMRTRAELMYRVERKILELSTFEVPEVASFSIQEWNAAYENWLMSVTAKALQR